MHVALPTLHRLFGETATSYTGAGECVNLFCGVRERLYNISVGETVAVFLPPVEDCLRGHPLYCVGSLIGVSMALGPCGDSL
jgi:hypothetical protein